MNVASLELCKELADLSGWAGTYFYVSPSNNVVRAQNATERHIPAYDLGYLLRKLPHFRINAHRLPEPNDWYFEAIKFEEGAVSGNAVARVHADTPEDAACELLIELIKQGVIKP